jgi:hypothetical protein
MRDLFTGAFSICRNPSAHDEVKFEDPARCSCRCFVLFVGAAHYHLQCIVRKGALQRFRLIPWCAQPHVAGRSTIWFISP